MKLFGGIFQIIWKSESRSQRQWKHQQCFAVGEWWLLFWQRNNLCLTAIDEIKSRCTEKWAKNRTQEKSAGLHLMLIVHDWGGSGESVNFFNSKCGFNLVLGQCSKSDLILTRGSFELRMQEVRTASIRHPSSKNGFQLDFCNSDLSHILHFSAF